MPAKRESQIIAVCPSQDELRAFLLGCVAVETQDRLGMHLETCLTCQVALSTLADEGDPVAMALRRTVDEEPVPNDSAYLRGLELVKRIGLPLRVPDLVPKTDAAGQVSDLGVLGQYQLLEKLGEGGMGAVYKALHTKLKRVVALKVLSTHRMHDPDAVARFQREMEAVGKLDHPNIVRAHDAGEANGTHFLVMEFVDGENLSQIVKRLGPLPIADACEIVRQAALGLEHAQQHGLVHRDVKPSNLMLAIAGTQARSAGVEPFTGASGFTSPTPSLLSPVPTLKILDLGLALLHSGDRAETDELTSTGQVMGTADYMAPEQVEETHRVDIRADIYSLGCVLYKLLTGHAPFHQHASSYAKMKAHVNEPLPRVQAMRPDVPDPLVAVLEKMIAKRPTDRHATPAEVAIALATFAAGSDIARLLTPPLGTAAQDAPPVTDNYISSAFTGTEPSAPLECGDLSPLSDSKRTTPSQDDGDHPQPNSQSQSGVKSPYSKARWLALAAAVLLLVLGGYVAQIVLKIKTPGGTIVLEGDPAALDGAEVFVDEQKRMTITTISDNQAIEVSVDRAKGKLKVVKGGFETFVSDFEIKARGKTPLKVSLRPLASVTRPTSILPDDPALLPNLQIWLRADSLNFADGEPVILWPDQSGQKRDFMPTKGVRGGVGEAPRFVRSSAIDGRPAVRFGLADGLAASPDQPVAIQGDAEFTIAVVFHLEPNSGDPPFDTIFGMGDGFNEGDPGRPRAAVVHINRIRERDKLHELQLAGGFHHDVGLGLDSMTALYGKPTLVVVTKEPGILNMTTQFFVNGQAQPVEGRESVPDIQHRQDIGAYIGKPLAVAGGIQGDIAEVVVLNRAVSDAERSGLERYLSDKYSLPLTASPKPLLAADTTADRKAAEWVLSLHGTVAIQRHKACATLRKGMRLPSAPFQVVEIDLEGRSVADADLARLSGLGSLEVLGLRDNRLTDAGLIHLQSLSNLSVLRLGKTDVTDDGLQILKGFPNLTGLDLRETRVNGPGLQHLKDLPKLTQLAVLVTTTGHLAQLKGLPLTNLNLQGSGVTDDELVQLQPLQSLEWFGLEHTAVTDAGLVHLKALPKLIKLAVQDSPVTGSSFPQLKVLSQLTMLDLAGTMVDDDGLAKLAAPNLTWLCLDRTQVTDAGLVHLTKLSQLELLFLNETKVTDAGLVHLKALPSLDNLQLDRTRVSDAGVKHLATFPTKPHLHLIGTRISARGFAALRAAVPEKVKESEWSEPNRNAALDVLGRGGTVHLQTEGDQSERHIATAQELPDEYFRVTRVSLAGVKYLNLPGGQHYSTVADGVGRLTDPEFDDLRSLDLSDTTLDRYDLQDFCALTQLRELSLAGTRVDDAWLEHLKGMTGLRKLVLDRTPIRGEGLSHLKDLPELTELSLGCPTLADLFLAHLAELPKLERLSLAGSGVTDAAIDHLAALKQLRHLDIGRTGISAPGAARLRAALPDCEFASGTGDPLSRVALVTQPAPLNGVESWTIETRRHRGGVFAVAYSADGRRLASGGDDGTIRLWDAESGQLQSLLIGHGGAIEALAWMPEGKLLASAGRDMTVRIWDTENARLLQTLRGHTGVIYAVVWSPDASSVASGGEDRTIRVWALAGGTLRKALGPIEQPIRGLAWSPGGEMVLSGEDANPARVRLWNVDSGDVLAELEGHSKEVKAVAWSPDGKRFASASGDSTVRVWDAVTREPLQTLETQDLQSDWGLHTVDWSYDGRHIAAGGIHGVRVWDATTGKPLATLPGVTGYVGSVRFAPNGSNLAVGVFNGGMVGVWFTWPASTRWVSESCVVNQHASWSPDSGLFAASSSQSNSETQIGPTANDTASWRSVENIATHPRSLRWSPSGKQLILSRHSHEDSIVDAETGHVLHDLKGHSGDSHVAQWSRDGRLVATAASDRTIRLWDAATGKQIRVIEGLTSYFNAVAWAPVGNRLASAGDDGSIRIWNTADGAAVGAMGTPGNSRALSLAYSPDGSTLAIGDSARKIHLWDATTGTRTDSFDGPTSRTESLAWSPDGKLLASGHWSGTAYIWNPVSAKRVELHGHSTAVLYLQWSHDGTTLFTSDWIGTARMWDVQSGRAIRTLCFTRPLQRLLLSADGHGIYTAAVGRDMRYVVQTARGQESLTPDDFATRFGWKNEPAVAAIATLPPATPPARRLAEYVLMLGGVIQIKIREGDVERVVNGVATSAVLPSGEFRVTAIYLNSNRLTDERLGELSQLLPRKTPMNDLSLHLFHSAVTDVGLAHLRGHQVQFLDLADTAVTERGFELLQTIDGLQGLSLRGPTINDNTLKQVGQINGLRELHLAHAAISDEGARQISQLKELGVINLQGTRMSLAAWTRFVADHPKLWNVDIAGTGLGDEGLRILSDLKQVTDLHVGDSGVTEGGLIHLKKFPSLVRLRLNSSQFTADGFATLSELSNLEQLTLNTPQRKPTETSIAHLARLKKLRVLELAGSGLADAGLAHLKTLSELETLDISDTAVTDTGVEHLIEWKRLRTVNIRGTKITAAGIERLRKELPNCNIEFEQSKASTSALPAPTAAAPERLLALGAALTVNTAGGTREVSSANELPAEPFMVTRVVVPAGSEFDDDDMDAVAELPELSALGLKAGTITNVGLAKLTRLSKLTSLELNDVQCKEPDQPN